MASISSNTPASAYSTAASAQWRIFNFFDKSLLSTGSSDSSGSDESAGGAGAGENASHSTVSASPSLLLSRSLSECFAQEVIRVNQNNLSVCVCVCLLIYLF